MAERIPNGVAKLVVFRAYLASDHVTTATGKTIAITISKNGGAFGNLAAGATNATEISSGFYKFTLATGDIDTNGPIAWRGAVATIDDAGDAYEVVNAFNAGFTGVPAVIASAIGGLLTAPTTANVGLADLSRILGTALTETAGLLAGGFKKFFNIATPAATMDHGILIDTITTYTGNTVQTGDNFARLGAPAGASHAADTAAIQADTDNIQTRLPAALTIDGNMKVDVLRINGNATSAAVLAILNGATVVYQGTVTGAATTTTLIDSGLTQADTDWWKGRIIIFTSVIAMQATDITAFDPATDKLTFTSCTQAPTGATYVII